MRVVCDNCHTVYESLGKQQGLVACPYCEHVNRPRGEARVELEPEPPIAADHDPLKTMVLQVDVDSRESARGTDGSTESAAPAPRAKLEMYVIVDGLPVERHRIRASRTTIGRGLCDIRVQDPGASREHCSIEVVDGVAVLKDLRSVNGTLLNHEVVTEHVLADGDEIRLGTTVLRFQVVRSE